MALQPPGRLLSSRRQRSTRRPPDPPGPPGRRGRRILLGSALSLPCHNRSDAGRSLPQGRGGACHSPPTYEAGSIRPSRGNSANPGLVVTASPPPALTLICVIHGVRALSYGGFYPPSSLPNSRRFTNIPTWPHPLLTYVSPQGLPPLSTQSQGRRKGLQLGGGQEIYVSRLV